jgi:Delta3-Delta2-enoyl-CoA isomerase
MELIQLSQRDGIAEVALKRGKVNAVNEPMVKEIVGCFENLARDPAVTAVILTSKGPFFSFGFDIPEFLGYGKDAFLQYLTAFADLYTWLFTYPKPVVAALNGHTIAAGCMLALACDWRIMVAGKARISLNEITFGSSLFAGSVRMLKFATGEKNAQTIAYDGAMYSAEEALRLELIDQISSDEKLSDDAWQVATRFASKDSAAFESIKQLLRRPVADEMKAGERLSLAEFADIWYSEKTWKNLQGITIRS